ncbi:MAG: nucleotidyltransferase [Acidobacteria bacterium]|nr:nucleotidyltransferase [Acidobacteriota bacterium]
MISDFKELLSILNAKQVKYLVIGGYAVMKYTEPRFTKDLDIWVWTDSENAKLVFQALRQFGAPLSGLTETDFTQPGSFYQMGRPPARVDVLMSIDGVRFEEAWENRVESDFDGVLAHIISKQDLIQAKRAAGRLQDLVDLESLTLPEKK